MAQCGLSLLVGIAQEYLTGLELEELIEFDRSTQLKANLGGDITTESVRSKVCYKHCLVCSHHNQSKNTVSANEPYQLEAYKLFVDES